MRTITSKRDFDRIFSSGKRAARPDVRVVVATSPTDEGRVAFVAPKRVGNAVFRNRCKRVLRACAEEAGLPRDGRDVVLLATRGTATAKHDVVVRELHDSVGQAERRLDRARKRASAGSEANAREAAVAEG